MALRKWGYFPPLAFALAVVALVLINLSMQADLFGFLGPGLYGRWWASLNPVRPGGVAWVLFGAVGIYMVYVQSVLGLVYVKFLKDLHRQKMYRFKANWINVDGFFGWSKLRTLITNLQMGALCTLLSAWAFSSFLEAAVKTLATIGVLSLFIGIVTYVYFAVNVYFRRQAERANNLSSTRSPPTSPSTSARSTRRTTSRYWRHIGDETTSPRFRPRRFGQRWLVAGVLSLLGTLTAIVVPFVEFFTS